MIGRCNVLVVGASLPGLATAARLAASGRNVILIEREQCVPSCGSALVDPICMPNGTVLSLAQAGAEMCRDIRGAVSEAEVLHLYGMSSLAHCVEMLACCVNAGTPAEQIELCDIECDHPYLLCGEDDCAAAVRLKATAVNGDAVYGHFSTMFGRCGGEMCFGEYLAEGRYGGGGWTVCTNRRKIRADVIVNCAGPSADEVARRCGTRRLGLVSYCRTMVDIGLVETGIDLPERRTAIFWDEPRKDLCCTFQAGDRVTISCNESDRCAGSPPEASARAIGTAMVCFEERTRCEVDPASAHPSARLMTYAEDSRPVIGWARDAPGFFWCAAMGDFNIVCAVAGSALASDMIQNRSEFGEVAGRYGIRRDCLCADRLSFAGVAA